MSSLLGRRRSALPAVLVLVGLGAASHVIGCVDDDPAAGGGGPPAEGGVTTLPEAAIGESDAAALRTTMRLAHLAPDLGPVDFCYRPAKSTAFEGPVLGQGAGPAFDASADAHGEAGEAGEPGEGGLGDGGAPAVPYRAVSRYVSLRASGTLTIALVAPGSTSCAAPLFAADVTLDVGKLATVALLGLGDPAGAGGDDAGGDTGAPLDAGQRSRALVAFVDDRSVVPEKARVRIINAAFGTPDAPRDGTPLAVRAVGAQTVTLAERVLPKKAGEPSAEIPVDALGYATLDVLPSPAQLAASTEAGTSPDASVEAWVSDTGELRLEGASLHTGFVLTGEGASLEIVWCSDTSTTGAFTTCERVR